MAEKNIVWHLHNITKDERAKIKNQKPCILWFTGLSGSGKSTIAGAVEQQLFERGHHTYLLDGDNVRHGLNKDLAFSDEDRVENIRRIGELSKLMIDAGLIVLTAFISPFRVDRKMVKDLVNSFEFIEIYMDTPIEECERRDPKGLYKKARKGEIKNFTGIDSDYEVPENPDVVVNTVEDSIQECANEVVKYLQANKIIDS